MVSPLLHDCNLIVYHNTQIFSHCAQMFKEELSPVMRKLITFLILVTLHITINVKLNICLINLASILLFINYDKVHENNLNKNIAGYENLRQLNTPRLVTIIGIKWRFAMKLITFLILVTLNITINTINVKLNIWLINLASILLFINCDKVHKSNFNKNVAGYENLRQLNTPRLVTIIGRKCCFASSYLHHIFFIVMELCLMTLLTVVFVVAEELWHTAILTCCLLLGHCCWAYWANWTAVCWFSAARICILKGTFIEIK